MVGSADKPTGDEVVEHIRKESRPDFSKPLPREKLPKELQNLIDHDEETLDALYSQ
jgi:hypothetical protein